jgi:hypothetical protein
MKSLPLLTLVATATTALAHPAPAVAIPFAVPPPLTNLPTTHYHYIVGIIFGVVLEVPLVCYISGWRYDRGLGRDGEEQWLAIAVWVGTVPDAHAWFTGGVWDRRRR